MLSDPQVWVSLLTLTALEVVLSIDNLVVIAILVGRLSYGASAHRAVLGAGGSLDLTGAAGRLAHTQNSRGGWVDR